MVFTHNKIAVLILTFMLISCSEDKIVEPKEMAKAVKTFTIESESDSIHYKFLGKVEAGKKAAIAFEVSGKLINLPIHEGDKIKAGDLLAQIDPVDYKLSVEKRDAEFQQVSKAQMRAKELLKEGYVSDAGYDKKKRAADVAKTNLNIAKQNLSYTEIMAPFDGVIAKIFVENYQNISAKEPIIILQNLNLIDVKFFVPEKVAIQKDNLNVQSVDIVFDSVPDQHFSAKIKEFSSESDPKTQSYGAVVRLPKPDGLTILSGMTATVTIKTKSKSSVVYKIELPSSAVFSDESKQSYVWLINAQNRLEKRAVSIDRYTNENVIITSGLNVSDKVVAAGVNFLRSNTLVKDMYQKGQY